MKKFTVLIITVFVFLSCVSTPQEGNPNTGPVLNVVIPELFSPSPDIENDTMTISIGVTHSVGIKDWSIAIQPIRPDPMRQSSSQGEQETRQRTGERQRRVFFEQNGAGTPPAQWKWDGKSTYREGEMVQSATDYQFVLSVNDIYSNNSVYEGVISVDVIVRRDGDKLRIVVPAITFLQDSAVFNEPVQGKLSEEAVRSNRRVLRLIAAALNKYPDYKITIEGHANPISQPGSAKHTREEPTYKALSEQRARAVGNYLETNNNIPRTRFSYIGVGTTRTVVAYNDTEELWKNRRVEFILER